MVTLLVFKVTVSLRLTLWF